MKYPPITYSLLKEKNACQDQLDLFEKYIGLNEPIPLTDETIQKFSTLFDIRWAAKNLLDAVDRNEYFKTIAPAYAEYDKVKDTAYAEYFKARATAKAEYEKGIAWAEYQKARATAFAEYDKGIATAWAEYNKATAPEFVRLYK